ncbi:hypothetical protein CVS30_17500 [Arthrobacter psychrolactophilus]|uniref:DUF6385 domain-containing protein n=1 Tax=Arthrobacter psychrolactophilus TaxID=92442 RepID=A0A2V5JJ11_9MICC|nr:DUF6385 domain-containing protein [Arthrobacter psychrolactophilus]PYI37046.1 hypothetical protein CVS30_17500 [Arthrobacter psychrolactophilus]
MQTIYTSVLARRVHINNSFRTLPYEAGWASEALVFVQAEGSHPDLTLGIDVSPDGITWLPRVGNITLSKGSTIAEIPITHFGNWLRVSVDGASDHDPARVLIHAALKG